MMGSHPLPPEIARRKAAITVLVTVSAAIIGIGNSLYTSWFIPVSSLIPIATAIISLAACSHYGLPRPLMFLTAFIALVAPAVCSWICWLKLIHNFIT
jgi:hypothetical protein